MLVWVAYKAARGIAVRVWRAGLIIAVAAIHFIHPRVPQVWRSHGLTALGTHQKGVVMDGVQRAGQGERALQDVEM